MKQNILPVSNTIIFAVQGLTKPKHAKELYESMDDRDDRVIICAKWKELVLRGIQEMKTFDEGADLYFDSLGVLKDAVAKRAGEILVSKIETPGDAQKIHSSEKYVDTPNCQKYDSLDGYSIQVAIEARWDELVAEKIPKLKDFHEAIVLWQESRFLTTELYTAVCKHIFNYLEQGGDIDVFKKYNPEIKAIALLWMGQSGKLD